MPVNTQQVDEWKQRAEALKPQSLKDIEKPLAELDAHLTLRSHIVGYETTEADTTVWKTLRENRVAYAYIKQGLMVNATRWFKFIEATSPKINVADRPAKTANTDGELKGSDANYDIGLQDTEHGVVTRFPPEPSYVKHVILSALVMQVRNTDGDTVDIFTSGMPKLLCLTIILRTRNIRAL